MKNVFKLFLILVLFTSFIFINKKTLANGEIFEEKIYADLATNSEYSLNSIIVILNNETSRLLDDYSIDDFREVNPKSINDLTRYTKNLLRNQKDNFQIIENPNDIRNRIDIDSFHQILELSFEEESKDNIIESIMKLQNREDIVYVGQNFVYNANSISVNDEVMTYDNMLRYSNMEIPQMWDITVGSSDVIVGVLDSGIDSSHPDLINNIYTGLHMDFSNGTSNSISTPDDLFGHGTLVSGIIGAKGNNQIGIAGVCWNIKLVSLKIANSIVNGNLTTYMSRIALGIDYATTSNIPILNLSYSGPADDNALKQSIMNYPGIIICSVDNVLHDIDLENINCYPAEYDLRNKITVGNVIYSDDFVMSAYGNNSVDLFAHGDYLISTAPLFNCDELLINCGGYSNAPHYCYGYHSSSGSSYSTPFVTGVAAAILSLRPSLTPEKIKSLILDNVDRIDYLEPYCKTGGRLNAYKAVRAAIEPETFMGDVNGDGKSDMILSTKNTNGKRAFKVFLADSYGNLSTTPTVTTSTRNFFYDDPAFVGDFNGDGRTDVLIHWVNGTRQLLLYRGKSDGTFYEGVNLSSTRIHDPINLPCKMFVMNVDGDNYDDFVVTYRNTSGYRGIISYLGTSSSPYLIDATSTFTSSNTYNIKDEVLSGNFNGDSYNDLIVQSKSQSGKRVLRIFRGRSNGLFYDSSTMTSSFDYETYEKPSYYFVGDINGDNKIDFIVSEKNNTYRNTLVYKGKSSSSYITDTSSYAQSNTLTYNEYDIELLGDFNNDGYCDIMIHRTLSTNYRQLLFYSGTNNATFNSALVTTTYELNDRYTNPCNYYVADVDGNGCMDVVIKRCSSNNKIEFLIYYGSTYSIFGSAHLYTNINYYE